MPPEQKQKFLPIIALILATIAVFSLGFYFGFQYAHKKDLSLKAEFNEQVESNAEVNQEIKPVEGVFWIKSGADPICPSTHPIKIKFDSGVCFFYTKENKSYSRVKPNICAVDENFALNEMGCLKKF